MADHTADVGGGRRRDALLQSAQSLCEAFANQESSLDVILSHFSTHPDTYCFEHSLPELAPFLGRKFVGHDQGVREYFEMIARLLSYQNMVFSDYIVDTDVNVVSVRGQAVFTWKSTNQSWSEVFVYRLQFDNDHHADAPPRVKVYEVWADSGAAYLASKGLLLSAPSQGDTHDE